MFSANVGERLVDPLPLLGELLARARRRSSTRPVRQHRPVAANLAADDRRPGRRPASSSNSGAAGRVDQPDPGPRQDQRPGVRIAAGRRGRDVDDRRGPRWPTRSSAAIRSRSAWSMIAMSPEPRRLTSSLVVGPSRALPVIDGDLGPRGSATVAPAQSAARRFGDGAPSRLDYPRKRPGRLPRPGSLERARRPRAARGRGGSRPRRRASAPSMRHDLGDQLVAVHPLDRRRAPGRPGTSLGDPEVRLGERRDLRQVGDADHLALGAQARAAARPPPGPCCRRSRRRSRRRPACAAPPPARAR